MRDLRAWRLAYLDSDAGAAVDDRDAYIKAWVANYEISERLGGRGTDGGKRLW